MHYTLMSGAGNLFAVFDGFEHQPPDNVPDIARGICSTDRSTGITPRPDGLLLLERPVSGGDCRMILFNADGSRPETCGNGLRCIAKLAFDRGHVKQSRFTIETDAGPRATEVTLQQGFVTHARIHMGTPRILARDEELHVPAGPATPATKLFATLVDMGNPHCVLFVDDERSAPVTTLGPLVEHHARFPHGTNVEFLALRREGSYLRVWERGVGETQACGSGACAAAVAAVARGVVRWPLRLHLPGGMLEVASDGKGGVFLSGPVETIRSGEWKSTTAAQRR